MRSTPSVIQPSERISLRVVYGVAAFSVVVAGAMFIVALAPQTFGIEGIAAREGVVLDDSTRFLVGLLGGTWAAMALLVAGLAKIAVEHRVSAALAFAGVGLGVWFVVDSTLSLVLGAPLNVLGNAIYLAAFAGPLLALRRGLLSAAPRAAPWPG